MMMFGTAIDDVILTAAKMDNKEICGVIAGGEVVFLPNVSDDPVNEFRINEIPDNTQAVFHSHPGGPFYPTVMDMRQQIAMDIPWGIAAFSDRHSEVFWFGSDAPKQPLVGRGFRHGVSDCYSLVQDFYKEIHGLDIMDVPRDWEWWNNEESLYENLFQKAGFSPINSAEILPGDAFLATIRSKTPNHAGVYLGDGLILHHTCGRDGYDPFRLSTVEPAARWFNFLSKVVRHENTQIDRTVGQKVW
jgi:cell wall-associated NlpC family hydrolase